MPSSSSVLPSPARLSLLSHLSFFWSLADLFFSSLPPSLLLHTPISLRNPFIFYLAHLPCFALHVFRHHSPCPVTLPPHPLDSVFLRGKDPDVDDPRICHDHSPAPPDWPSLTSIQSYISLIRSALRDSILSTPCPSSTARLVSLVCEHDGMHLETLRYMLSQTLLPSPRMPKALEPVTHEIQEEWTHVSAGWTWMGNGGNANTFCWDNEMNGERRWVNDIKMSKYAVCVKDWCVFMQQGGYERKELWDQGDWEWRERDNVKWPKSWGYGDEGWMVLTGTKARKVEQVGEWPVSVSLAEAKAYCKWRGGRVMKEEEWLRGMFGEKGARGKGGEGRVKEEEPGSVREGTSGWFGAVELMGNGWEWTETVLERFEGFSEMKEYREYTKDFFDGKHYVMKGASWGSSKWGGPVRPTFRNFYQARYGYVFGKFRVVKDMTTDAACNISSSEVKRVNAIHQIMKARG